MNILVINSGSSSIKYQLIDVDSQEAKANGIVERIGLEDGVLTHKYDTAEGEEKIKEVFFIENHSAGLSRIAEHLLHPEYGVIQDVDDIDAVGHRVVHGGEKFSDTCEITEDVKEGIKELFPLASLHNPANLQGVIVAEDIFPNARQVAVFDTAFHQTIPDIAYRYAIPEEMYTVHGIRKYGFHGTSHKYVSKQAADFLNKPDAKIITIHLGNGCSMAAVDSGKCVDTSMGLGPISGLMMGTRCGDIDPLIIFHMMKKLNLSAAEVSNILTKESGVKGLTGFSDMRDVEDAYAAGDEKAIFATHLYAYKIKQYIGSFAAAMNGLDAIVFTAGVGENDTGIRRCVCEDMDYFGIKIDLEKNDVRARKITEIHTPDATTSVLIVPTNEELEIANQVAALK